MPVELTDKEKVKLAIISTEEVPEKIVEKIFLENEANNQEDLLELWGTPTKHRPSLAKKLAELPTKQPRPNAE